MPVPLQGAWLLQARRAALCLFLLAAPLLSLLAGAVSEALRLPTATARAQ